MIERKTALNVEGNEGEDNDANGEEGLDDNTKDAPFRGSNKFIT